MALWAGVATAGPQYEWLSLDSRHVKWGEPAAGTGTVVTYAYVSRTTHTDDARNCRDMQPLGALVERWRLPSGTLESEAEAAFAMWEAVADIRFRRVEQQDGADILIGGQAVPRGIAFADVAYGEVGSAGMRSIRRSLICLNPEKTWVAGFDGDVKTYDLRFSLAHEIGHAIGLDHAGPSGQLMSFRYEERFRELQPGDITGIVGLYGARPGRVARTTALAPEAPDGRVRSSCDDDTGPVVTDTALAPGRC